MFSLANVNLVVQTHNSRWRPDHPITCGDLHRTLISHSSWFDLPRQLPSGVWQSRYGRGISFILPMTLVKGILEKHFRGRSVILYSRTCPGWHFSGKKSLMRRFTKTNQLDQIGFFGEGAGESFIDVAKVKR